MNNQEEKVMFYKKEWFLWISVFLLPPIGIILVLKNRRFDTKKKVALTLISIFCWAGMILFDKYQVKEETNNENILAEKREQDKLNKESEFDGITVGQKERLEDIFKVETDKKLLIEGKEYKDYKMSKTDNSYIIYGTKVTEERGVDINNLFTVGIYWDGESDNYEVHTNSFTTSVQLSTQQENKLYDISKEAVKANLVAPKTAKFPFIDRPTIKYNFDNVTNENSIFYQIYSKVEYKNAFNVEFESNYLVEVEVNWIDGNYTILNTVIE